MNKQLTEQAMDILEEEGMQLFSSINEYVEYVFSETNFHDGLIMLKALENEIDGYILTQNEFYFIADFNNIYIDIEDYFEQLEFEGKIFEED